MNTNDHDNYGATLAELLRRIETGCTTVEDADTLRIALDTMLESYRDLANRYHIQRRNQRKAA